MKKILDALYQHQQLGYQEAREILSAMAAGAYNPSQIASFITVFLMRGVSVQELSGFRDALMDLCLKTDLGAYKTIDLCGTGGDEKNTFNISTLASFVVAGVGVKVTKHGNYGQSSVSGSSNVLEYLGYRFKNDAALLRIELDKTGICFLHAPLFHPAMKTVAPIRKELGVKTFFNMLGPLVNPAQPSHQLTGVYSLELARMYHYLFQQGEKNYAVIHGMDGFDECSLTSATKVFDNQGEHLFHPEDFGSIQLKAEEISGGDSVQSAAKIFMAVLENHATEAQTNVVIANAALALRCARGLSLPECILQARESIQSKKALEVFKKLISLQS